jgi:hypothetical protein
LCWTAAGRRVTLAIAVATRFSMNARGLAVVVLLTGATATWAMGPVCGGCWTPPPTLREEANSARLVIYGVLSNPRRTGADSGTTDVVVLRVLKSDPAIVGKTVLRIDRYIDVPDPANPPAFLLFADLSRGQPDFYRGEAVEPVVADYLAGSLAIDEKDRRQRLKYCARFLDFHDPAIATDAFAEFSRATDPDLRAAGRGMDADRLRRLLRSNDTLANRRGVYARLLAECGNRSDALLLREILDQWADGAAGLDGVLAAYTVLDPPAGWAYICDLIGDPHNEFVFRYTGLRTARYFQTERPDVLPSADRLRAHRLALRHPDLADLAIDDLRLWQWWGLTDEVLALPGRAEFDAPLIRRSVLRYALRCPGEPASRFVRAACEADRQRVAAMRQFLAAEERSGK